MIQSRSRRKLRRSVTPAISVMIVLSVSIAFALVVGIFSYGFLAPNADEVTLTLGNIAGGTTADNVSLSSTIRLVFELNNPGRPLNITELQISENGLVSPITTWAITPNAQIGNSLFSDGNNLLPGGRVSTFTLYPVQSPVVTIKVGETCNYVITLSNGQSISGYLVAQ